MARRRCTPGDTASFTATIQRPATQERPTFTDAWGRLALMPDPFGHAFCFVQFLNRGYDEIAT